MVTNNFYKRQRANFINAAPVLIDETGAEITTIKAGGSSGRPYFVDGTTPNAHKMLFGTSDTAPTGAEFNLLSENTNFTQLSFTVATTDEDGKTVVTFTKVAQYTGEETIEIKEAGIFQYLNKNSNTAYWFLMAREVFATPVTVSNGDTITVSISVKF